MRPNRNHTNEMIPREVVMNIGRIVAICAVISTVSACKFLTPNTIRGILNAAEWTCILLEQSTDADEVIKACGIAEDLKPAVEQAIAGKAAATKAGYRNR